MMSGIIPDVHDEIAELMPPLIIKKDRSGELLFTLAIPIDLLSLLFCA